MPATAAADETARVAALVASIAALVPIIAHRPTRLHHGGRTLDRAAASMEWRRVASEKAVATRGTCADARKRLGA